MNLFELYFFVGAVGQKVELLKNEPIAVGLRSSYEVKFVADILDAIIQRGFDAVEVI